MESDSYYHLCPVPKTDQQIGYSFMLEIFSLETTIITIDNVILKELPRPNFLQTMEVMDFLNLLYLDHSYYWTGFFLGSA